jgi:hypothetical protein
MRATSAATAALTLVLSGSLAAGLAGTAAAAPRDTDSTDRQLRAIKNLGQLAELTGDLGRLTRDDVTRDDQTRDDDASALTRALHERVDRKIRQILTDISEDRTAKTLPAIGENGTATTKTTRTITFTDAANSFRHSVRHISGGGDSSANSRDEAADTLLRRLSAVNKTVMNEVGLSDASSTSSTSAPASSKAATTTTLIDRETLSSGDLGRYDEAVEAVGDLLEDVNESPDGRLSRTESAEHARDIDESLTPLERRSSTREDAARLRDGTDALLALTRTGSTGEIRTEAGRLMKESVKLLATLPDSRTLDDVDGIEDVDDLYDTEDADTDDSDDAGDSDGAGDSDSADVTQMWTGVLLSPTLR